MANKCMKINSASQVIREIQSKTTMRYHSAPVRMSKIQNTDTPNADKAVEQKELSFDCW